MKRIAVFGGSFDPPTIAHEAIIRSAVKDLDAEQGIVIPCADEYIRGMKGMIPMFPADKRLAMLKAAFASDADISVDSREIDASSDKGRTLLTMRELKTENPESELIFVTGADKLATLPRWGGGLFLKEFRAAVYPRGGEIPCVIPDGVVMLQQVAGISGISAGRVRDALKRNEDISAFVSGAVNGIIGENDEQKRRD